jgi:hypothetical protein
MFSQKSVLSLCLLTAVNLTAFSQVKNSFKFDFGTGAVAKGYQAVSPSDYYSKAKGLGLCPTLKSHPKIELLKMHLLPILHQQYFLFLYG